MPDPARAILLAVFTLTSAIWIGGYVMLPIVARVATKELDASARVVFFRSLGRVYGIIGTTALIIALATGAGLMTQITWDATAWVTVGVAALLVVALIIGMAQARAMTRMRRQLARQPDDTTLAERVSREARRATWLRAGLGVLTLVLIGLGCALAA